MIYNSVLELVGNTPLLRLNNIEKELGLKAKLLAKLEFLNPAGSVKDRVGLALIEEAEKKGLLNKDSVIIEPTSGNTGIGLAMAAAVKGYKAIIVMPETMSEERKKLMIAHGAELVLTDGKKGMSGAIEKAEELAKEIPNSFIPDQFSNPDNALAHYKTTGPEILKDTKGEVDIFVAGIGTGGTITGTGKFLKENIENIKIVGAEPLSSPVLTKGTSGAHKIQGIGAGFVPKVLDQEVLDEVITVSDEDAISTAREFGKLEGFLIGISGGAALHSAIELGKRKENEGKTIVLVLPDNGSRYLSSDLY
ncbi:MAG: cysteine synthase A [Clostridia bacterium]|nr:cysteine synthase A [Clostridia bacterium]